MSARKPTADKPSAADQAAIAQIEALTADVRRWRAEDRATWAPIMASLKALLPDEPGDPPAPEPIPLSFEERVALATLRLLEGSGILDREDPA